MCETRAYIAVTSARCAALIRRSIQDAILKCAGISVSLPEMLLALGYSLQRGCRACDVGSCEPGTRVYGLHNARDRLCSLSKAHDLVLRTVSGGLGRSLEVPMAGLVGRVSHGGFSSWEDSRERSIEARLVSMNPT